MKTVQKQVSSAPTLNFFFVRPTYQPDLPPFELVTVAGDRVAFGRDYNSMNALASLLNDRLLLAESLGIVSINHFGA